MLRTRARSAEVPTECISTGNFAIDYKVIQVGGVPKGRITEIFGPESSGKTTMALQIVAEAQRLGGLVAYIDAEHSLDLAALDCHLAT